MLGIQSPDNMTDDDKKKLSLFREALKTYEGSHAFHNFTDRKEYLNKNEKQGEWLGASPSHCPKPPGSPSPAAELAAQSSEKTEMLFIQRCEWIDEESQRKDDYDRVGPKHYRVIHSFTADEPTRLVAGGVPCVRLEVSGSSFMIHQIRHMIGGAVAVVAGVLPLQLLEAMLDAPSRSAIGEEDATIAHWTGTTLELRSDGQAAQTLFKQKNPPGPLNVSAGPHPDWGGSKRAAERTVSQPVPPHPASQTMLYSTHTACDLPSFVQNPSPLTLRPRPQCPSRCPPPRWTEESQKQLLEDRVRWIAAREAAKVRRLQREAEKAVRMAAEAEEVARVAAGVTEEAGGKAGAATNDKAVAE
eukprot:gene30027-17921_t